MQKAIKAAAAFVGSQAALARELGVQKATVNAWVKGRNRVPAEKAVQIEQLTNKTVTRKDLRPDLFD
ncbi:transcriptional regulator [Kingella kingae]|uniref:transcriptional regulator n=1 Tax=Kingella kingae TaxID=504 RepID=UPI000761A733